MFESLVITLREGVEAALVLGIALTLLERRRLQRLKPWLWLGAGVALLLAAVLGALTTRLVYNQELAEGIAMMVGAVLVGTLVWWMWRVAPHFRQEIESGIERATRPRHGSAGAAFGLFLFSFAMVFREGAETAIFLSAVSFTSQGLGMWLGAAAGLLLALVFGVLFVRGALRIAIKPFFTITSAVLLLLAVQLLVGGLHELSEAQVLPSSKAEMALIGPLVRNELLLFTLTVALAAGWLLFGSGASAVPTPAPGVTSGPQGRIERATRARDRTRRRWTGIVAVVVVGFLSMAFAQGSRIPAPAPATPLPLVNGVVRLDATPCRDGDMHFFEATLPEGAVRFFAILVGEEIRTAFDACEICGDVGYFQDRSSVICRNCMAPISLPTIGRSGGCNPIPLLHRLEGDRLVIAERELREVLPHLGGR